MLPGGFFISHPNPFHMRKRLWLLLSGLCLLVLCPHRASAQYYGVGVNVAMLMTGKVNASFEAAFALHWSVDIPLMWNPVRSDKVQMRLIAVQPGVRYWFFEEYAGHFIGTHLAAAKYDIGGSRFHRKGWLTGLGVSYGYSWLLSTRWNLTVEAGLGLYYMKDTRRDHHVPDDRDEYICHARRLVLGPSKLGVGFTYLF